MTRYLYTACGLAVESSFAIPELAGGARDPDVRIRFGAAPEILEGARPAGVLYQSTPGRFLLNVPGIARYLALDGCEIVVDPAPAAGFHDIRVFLLNSVLGALLHQRRALPLHGAAIAAPAGAVLFLGQTGTGKSTLAAEFRRRGYPVLADEICAVSADSGGALHFAPAYPGVRVWSDALDQLEETRHGLIRVRAELEKYHLPTEGFSPEPLPVAAIYGLHPANTGELSVTPLEGAAKSNELISAIFRPRFRRGMGFEEGPHPLIAPLASAARVARVVRPRLPFLIRELATMLEADFT